MFKSARSVVERALSVPYDDHNNKSKFNYPKVPYSDPGKGHGVPTTVMSIGEDIDTGEFYRLDDNEIVRLIIDAIIYGEPQDLTETMVTECAHRFKLDKYSSIILEVAEKHKNRDIARVLIEDYNAKKLKELNRDELKEIQKMCAENRLLDIIPYVSKYLKTFDNNTQDSRSDETLEEGFAVESDASKLTEGSLPITHSDATDQVEPMAVINFFDNSGD